MQSIDTLRELFHYNDQTDRVLFTACAQMSDEQLDKSLDLGLGSLRRICRHILAGESVWLARYQKQEVAWPDEKVPLAINSLLQQLENVWRERDQFLSGVTPSQLAAEQIYRDSKGSLFRASLEQMLIQGVLHSHHHRAQVCNGIRRVGGNPPELDYMYSVRKPAMN